METVGGGILWRYANSTLESVGGSGKARRNSLAECGLPAMGVRDGHGMEGSTHILYCHCSYSKVVPPRVKQEVLDRLTSAGVPFDAVPDLCALAARRDPVLKRIAEAGEVRIAACFPRAVKWLFHAAGTPLGDERVKVLNMREGSAEEVVAGLVSELPTSNGADGVVAQVDRIRDELGAAKPGAWVPWVPVIDYDRCTNCKQCLSFCLFGVFGVDADDRERVRLAYESVLIGIQKAAACEYRIRRADGEERWIQDRIRTVTTEGERRAFGVISDVTDARRAEE